MSTLETNNIGKYNGNNISFNDPIKLKQYTTAQIDALTGMTAGDMVYDTDEQNKLIMVPLLGKNNSAGTFSAMVVLHLQTVTTHYIHLHHLVHFCSKW